MTRFDYVAPGRAKKPFVSMRGKRIRRAEYARVCIWCHRDFVTATANKQSCTEKCARAYYEAQRRDKRDHGGGDHHGKRVFEPQWGHPQCPTCAGRASVSTDWLGRTELSCPRHGAVLMPKAKPRAA